jgi:hypothetical protein
MKRSRCLIHSFTPCSVIDPFYPPGTLYSGRITGFSSGTLRRMHNSTVMTGKPRGLPPKLPTHQMKLSRTKGKRSIYPNSCQPPCLSGEIAGASFQDDLPLGNPRTHRSQQVEKSGDDRYGIDAEAQARSKLPRTCCPRDPARFLAISISSLLQAKMTV